jgi:hypothetical protein
MLQKGPSQMAAWDFLASETFLFVINYLTLKYSLTAALNGQRQGRLLSWTLSKL